MSFRNYQMHELPQMCPRNTHARTHTVQSSLNKFQGLTADQSPLSYLRVSHTDLNGSIFWHRLRAVLFLKSLSVRSY